MNKFKLTILMAVSFLTLFLSACKKDATSYTCTTCKTTPDALAANDNSSKGIYKGIVIGSSGTIMFDVMNSGSTITATLVIDGVTTTLTSNVVWSGNSAYVGNFTGTMNGSPVSIKLSLNIDGSDPTITSSDIPGHPNAIFDIAKETSQNLVECFEGTYETDEPESGVFNLLLSRSAKVFGGRARQNGSTETNGFSGIITSTNELKDNDSEIIFGKLTGDVISGTFKDEDDISATITANRKW